MFLSNSATAVLPISIAEDEIDCSHETEQNIDASERQYVRRWAQDKRNTIAFERDSKKNDYSLLDSLLDNWKSKKKAQLARHFLWTRAAFYKKSFREEKKRRPMGQYLISRFREEKKSSLREKKNSNVQRKQKSPTLERKQVDANKAQNVKKCDYDIEENTRVRREYL